ncbi:type II toxin-antitoxin system PemK/MazF family toxin [Thiocystis violascens]|uniref:Growth inhibitor n=1 Tax=Thiocystis violascens (strain ATCC 17096 / DSM 198 / 6111) TaxID=765911 RepID=I3YFF7_THIV6|nr:type II toxin-antitoxin system PemK/MazF family toxin [Thiocystis violascens]AFL75725.1 growth inhibitor [Thiocystis violascens DSM 198]
MIPDRGDIVHLAFDPSTGKEMRGNHFALVVSPKAFNRRFALAMVCPISGGQAIPARQGGFLVSLMGTGCLTDGNIHIHQLKSVDFVVRQAKKIESVPDHLLEEIREVIATLFAPDAV